MVTSHRKYLDFKYQPLVDTIYELLSEEKKSIFNNVYQEISIRNANLLTKPIYKIFYGSYVTRKILYFITSLLSFVFIYVGGAFIKTALTWFIHGVVIRGVFFSLYQGIIELSKTIFGGMVGSCLGSEFVFDSNTLIVNVWEQPNWMMQMGYEIIYYALVMMMIWLIINFGTFYLRNRKYAMEDTINFDFSVDKSLFMLQSDKDDTIAYVRHNFYQRYIRYIGSEFQTKKYITSYVNIIESGCLEVDISKSMGDKQLQRQRIVVAKEAMTHFIGWISYTLFSSIIIIGPLIVYYTMDITTGGQMQQMLSQLSWWSTMEKIGLSVADLLLVQASWYATMDIWIKTWLGIWLLYIFIVLIKNANKRLIRPIRRQRERYINYINKVNEGKYDGISSFKSVSLYHVWVGLFFLILLPSIIFVIWNT